MLFVLGFLGMTSPLASDMYLSSFTEIQQDLMTTASQVQLTLTTFLLGMGLGQLFLGPLSDRYGRRPVLLTALVVFTVSSIACIVSPSIWFFIILRTLQGLSGAACIVLSNAIAADLTRGPDTVRALSLIAMTVGLGPVIAPMIGAGVGAFFGWRGVLAALALLAALMLLLAWLVIPESLPQEDRHAGGISTTFKNMGTITKDGRFMLLVVVFACGFGGMMAYISASPFVGQVVLGMNPTQYALAFAVGALSLVTANSINAKVAGRANPLHMMMVGIGLSVSGGTLVTILVLTGTLTIPLFILSAFMQVSGLGFTRANATALGLARTPHARGSGSALLGSSQFLMGSLVSPIVGAWGESTALPMALTMLGTALVGLTAGVAFWVLREK